MKQVLTRSRLAALSASLGLTWGARIEAQNPADAVIQAARQRAAAVKVVSLEWSRERAVPKNAVAPLLAGAPVSVDPRAVSLDLRLKGEFAIDADGRMRIHSMGEMPTLVEGKVVPAPHDSLLVFDGNAMKSYTPPGPVPHGQGFVSHKQRPLFVEATFWPILVYYRWSSGVDLPPPLSIRADTLTPRDGPKDNAGLRTFRHSYPIPNTKLTAETDFVVDPKHDYRVVQIDQYAMNKLAARIDIEYGSLGGQTLPVRWTTQQFGTASGLTAIDRVEVLEAKLNPDAGNLFAFTFPADTRLVDSDTADVIIVRDDASERRVTDTELRQGLSNAQILEFDSRQAAGRWRWLLVGGIGLVLIGGVSYWIWRRSRSRPAPAG